MTQDELIATIRALTDYGGFTLKEIETTLHIPKNHLSGMLNGTKHFAPKWLKLLILWAEATVKGDKTIMIPLGAPPSLPSDNSTKKVKTKSPSPEESAIRPPTRMPPPGLTKTQQIRWHRENSQTLH